MRFLLLFLSLLLLEHVLCDSVFRFGAVLSTTGDTAEMQEARNGYALFFDHINAESDGRGFFLEGREDTGGFYFQYDFLWREDESDPERHAAQVRRLLRRDRVHFLGGSHAAYANAEMQAANDAGVLNYHCCVEPDVFYEQDFPFVFGITVSNREYTKNFVRALVLAEIGQVMIVYEEGDTYSRTTCEAANLYFQESGGIRPTEGFIRPFNRSTTSVPDFFQRVAEEAKTNEVQAVVACVYPDDGTLLVNAFHDIQYALRSFFLTIGPTRQSWVDAFEPQFKSNNLFSGAQWHRKMRYEDAVFQSSLEYSELYEEMYNGETPTWHAAAASAVGMTLTWSIRDAFSTCDISQTEGDVDALLFDPEAIDCDDGANVRGYDRVIEALEELDHETFFGWVKFNFFRRNVGMETVTTQVFERELASGETRQEIEAVMPVSYATQLAKFPADNPYKETCQPGTYVRTDDQFNPCVACDRGEASSEENAPHCDTCLNGEYNDRIGQSSCKQCPEGTHTEIRGAKRLTECKCRPGYFTPTRELGLACEQCPDGAECAGGTDQPVPLFGYWANETVRTTMYPCDPENICLGGDDVQCDVGYTGRLCSQCEEGYFSVIQRCHKCVPAVLIVLVTIILLVGWYVINVIVSRSVSSLEMILAWAQLANIIGDINLNWTSSVVHMFGVANLLDFDVDILEPSCLFNWGFRQNFIIQLLLPFIMSFMAASGYLNSSIAYSVMVKNKRIHLEDRAKEILSLLVEVPEDQDELQKKWDTTIATFSASVDIMYVTIAKYCFDAFKCEDIAGVSVLREAPNVVCSDNSDHAVLVALASFGILFYVIGYPAFVCWKLYDLSLNASFSDPVNLRRFGFIYQKYELDYFFTPAIMLIRKLLFVLVLVYMNNPAFQVGTLAIIINASLMIHVYTAPYVDTYLDVLFSFLLVALMFEAFGGLMFYSENLPSANREILEWVVLASMIVLSIVFLAIFFMEIFAKYQVHFLKKAHQRYVRGNAAHPIRKFFSLKKDESSNPIMKSNSAEEEKEISYELLETFKPGFVYKCMKNHPEMIKDWDTLTDMLKDYMSDQSDTSYLSVDPIAKFWRQLVDRFPELVDFLAVADETTREKFNEFATNLYRNFYLSNKVTPLPLMDVLNWRDYAPMAQWLAIASSEDRQYFLDFVSEMFRVNGHDQAADVLATRIQHGGSDPHLERRVSMGVMTRQKKKILKSLNSGSHPFRHSATRTRVKKQSMLSLGFARLRGRHFRDRSVPAIDVGFDKSTSISDSAGDSVHTHTEMSERPFGESSSKKRENETNNGRSLKPQESQNVKSVTFSFEEEPH